MIRVEEGHLPSERISQPRPSSTVPGGWDPAYPSSGSLRCHLPLDYPTWAIPAEAFASGSLRIWRRQFRRAWRRIRRVWS